MSVLRSLMWLLAGVATAASLAACGSGNGARTTTTTTTGSAGITTETFRLSQIPDLYWQFQGTPKLLSGFRFPVPPPARWIRVPKPHGPYACTILTGKVTVRLYGTKSNASSTCKIYTGR